MPFENVAKVQFSNLKYLLMCVRNMKFIVSRAKNLLNQNIRDNKGPETIRFLFIDTSKVDQ